jgi:phage terminase large subunit
MSDLSIEALQYYEDNPIEYCSDILHLSLDTWQKEATQALHDKHFVAVRSGSGIGKSWWLGGMISWFLGTKPFSKIPATAPSKHQLEDVLWGELYRRIQGSPYMQELCTWTQTKVAVKGYEPSWYAAARTARVSPDGTVAEGLSGFHAEENLLFVIDEASGVHDAVFPAMEGALSGKRAYAILTSNPTRLSGYYYSVFNDLKMRNLWHTMHVSCYDSSYVEDRYIKMMEARYGKDHPIFQIKVLGDFPASDIFLLFPVEDVDVMKNNRFADVGVHNVNINKEIGVDIGRSIAKSVACIRQGNKIIEWSERGMRGTITDVPEIAEWVIALILAYNPSAVKIDASGIGAGVYDIVRRLYPKITKPVLGNIAPESSKKSRYVNLRAQGFWELREVLRTIYIEKPHDSFFDEIVDIRYKLSGDKILVESKEEMIRRIGRSPDFVDATVYAFLNPDLCVDMNIISIIPHILTNLNESMTKTNIWTPSDENVIYAGSRFGALHV